MRIVRPGEGDYREMTASLRRRAMPVAGVRDAVAGILEEVRSGGDGALRDLTERFDGVRVEVLRVSEEEMAAARAGVSEQTREAVAASLANISAFAERSLRKDWSAVNPQGVEVGERFDPFQRVGLYVPGGKAPLVSTALMTGGFARAAGVPEIVAMTPPGADGKVNADLLYALREVGASEIYKVGGAQGIGALAYGTETIRAVDKIFGPGNRYVVEAKRQVLGAVAIDLLPGPSEVLVVCDDSGRAEFLAADLLAQAEHGADGVVGLITTSERVLREVEAEVKRQLAGLERRDLAEKSLASGGFLVLVEDLGKAVELCNDFAPEHLVLVVEDEDRWLAEVRSAGAVYVGNYSAVAVGDFLAGPSHTLPTGGAGRSFSGLRADQFQRRTSVVRMDREGLAASAKVVRHFAKLEGLGGHGESVRLRLEGSGE